MSSLKKLSKINQRTKYAVYGWIRKAEQELNFNNIPMLISCICILYFSEEDIFEILQQEMKLSNNKKIIWRWSTDRCWENCSCCYGNIVIPSMSDTVCRWDLRVRKLNHKVSLSVGISSETKAIFSNHDISYLIHDDGFRNNIGCNIWDYYCHSFFANDNYKISIKLDLINAEIRYFINDNDQGIAFKNVMKKDDINYRLCVCIEELGTEIEIVSFQRDL